MRLTLRNLLELLDQTGWGESAREALRENIREPNRARIWIDRVRAVRSNPQLKINLDGLRQLENSGSHNINSLAAFLDRKLDSASVNELEQFILQNDLLLKDLILSDIAIRYASKTRSSIPVEMRQAIYRLSEANGHSSRAEPNGGGEQLEKWQEDTIDFSNKSKHKHDNSKPVGKSVPTGNSDGEPVLIGKNDRPQNLAERKTLLPLALTLALAFVVCGSFVAGWWFANRFSNPSVENTNRPNDQLALTFDKGSESDDKPDATILPLDQSAVEDNRIRREEEQVSPLVQDQKPDDSTNTDATESDANLNRDEATTQVPDEVAAIGGGEEPKLSDEGSESQAQLVATIKLGEEVAVVTSENEPLALLTSAIETAAAGVPIDLNVGSEINLENAHWVVASPKQILRQNQPLFVLRGARPEFHFDGGAAVRMYGPTWATINDQVQAGLNLQSGRVLLRANAAGQTVDLGTRFGIIRLELIENATEIAVDTFSYYPPGVSLDADQEQHILQVLVMRGSTNIAALQGTHNDDESRVSIVLSRNQAMEYMYQGAIPIDQPAQPRFGTFIGKPTWMDNEPASSLTMAMDQMKLEFRPGFQVVTQLEEFLNHRRDEVHVLSLQNLVSLGYYHYVVDFFDAARYRNHWSELLHTLRHDLFQTPGGGDALKFALDASGSLGNEYYKLLTGYSVEEINERSNAAKQSEAAAHLVDLLQHDKLAVRVLALENLRLITGETHLLRPDLDLERRKKRVKKWQTVEVEYARAPGPEVVWLEPIDPSTILKSKPEANVGDDEPSDDEIDIDG
ncbi:MAG TPA: hypothetical protein PKD64_07815 [Pirellulaceae bacterium]|nr:hypothetical protein [Pirellulaceae bacterium]HMO92094.1 hypothetical protein [Pirellulaceae bacterium]HMP69318.1 hypothetical protein [Pirellulaceae bacterium]